MPKKQPNSKNILVLLILLIVGLAYFAGKNKQEPIHSPAVQPTPNAEKTPTQADQIQITAVNLDTTKWLPFETTFPSSGNTMTLQYPAELTLVDNSKSNETIWFYTGGVSGRSPSIEISTGMLKGAINEKMDANTASVFTIGTILVNQYEYSHGTKWVLMDPNTDQKILAAHIAFLAGQFTEEEIAVGKEMMNKIVKTIQIERK
ncbi:hypothetical protein KBC79_03000 [Candidatus Woesebacteria bacterium]|nr:hypothetical protein [Candidatus Woesebacteria bacterium]